MTEEQQDAATDTQEPEGEQPTPQFSGPSEEQSSAPEVNLDALADKVADRLGSDLRRAQSFKDQYESISEQLGGMDRINEFMELVDSFEGDRDKAMQEYRLRTIERSIGGGERVDGPDADLSGVMSAEELEAEVTDILESAGISGDEAKNVREEWAKGEYELSDVGYRKALKDLTSIATRTGREVGKRTQPAGQATVMSGGSTMGQPTALEDDELLAAIQEHQETHGWRGAEDRKEMIDEAIERGIWET